MSDPVPATAPSHDTTPPLFPWWFVWTVFVVYGSLVPLAFVPKPFDAALNQFAQLPMLDIGVAGRADWVANGVLYAPVGFLTTALLLGGRAGLGRKLWAAGAAIAFGVALAVGVEFTQIFFPQRTVSMNDVLAEAVGTVVGAAFALWGTPVFRGLLATLHTGTAQHPRRLVASYAFAYVALSLFPYDLLLSQHEFADKFAGDLVGWWLAPASWEHGAAALIARLGAEALTTVPLGFLWARWRGRRTSAVAGMLAGVAFGAAIEAAQLLFASGVSQGASAVARGVGLAGGVYVWNRRAAWQAEPLRRWLRRASPLVVPLYLAGLVVLGGWFGGPWQSLDGAADRLANDVRFIPFYYHYYTSEALAVISLTSVLLLYAPVGLIGWAWGWGLRAVAVAALGLAAVVELGKLFPQATHPDPTNLAIAAAAAAACLAAVRRLSGATPAIDRPRAGTAYRPARFGAAHAGLLLLLAFAAGWLAAFPVEPVLLGALLTGYGLLVWWRPVLVFAAVPAALPLLDLAPWSGRLFFDEFDLWLLIGVSIAACRTAPVRADAPPDRTLRTLALLLGASYVIGTLRGAWPWPVPELNAFDNYLSPYNAVRIAKGALWAALLCRIGRRLLQAGAPVAAAFSGGMMFALAGTTLWILWERNAFSGLLDFATPYRVSGPIAAMQIGGAYLDAVLIATTPFVLGALLTRRRPILARIAAALLFIGATYATVVTFTRSTYAAFAIVVLLMAAAFWRGRHGRGWAAAGIVLLAGAAAALVLPFVAGPFAASRAAATGQDLGIREEHWQHVLALREPGAAGLLFGAGIGRFPSANYWSSPPAERSASFDLVGQGGNHALRLGTGHPLYVDQQVAARAGLPYRLALDARAAAPGAKLYVQLCRKHLLTSVDCDSRELPVPPGNGAWTPMRLDLQVKGDEPAGEPAFLQRPVRLSFSNAGTAAVEIDNVVLNDAGGRDLVRNGSFDAGLDHWTFTSDDHLAWHAKSLPLGLFFEQGLFGIVAWGALLALALARAGRRAWQGDLQAAALAAALVGFLVLSLFDTLLDMPRFVLLLATLAWLAAAGAPPRQTERAGVHDGSRPGRRSRSRRERA